MGKARQAGRRVDLVLGLLIVLGVVTGVGGWLVDADWPVDPVQVHAAAALAIVLVAPWKVTVIRRGLGRAARAFSTKALSLTLAGLVIVTVATGLIHSTGRLEYVGPLTLMQIHVGAAVGSLVAVLLHFTGHAVRPRRTDTDRRALLRLAVLGAGAAAATVAWDSGAAAAGRRPTGSVPKGELRVTSWFDDGVQRLDGVTWTLRAGARTFDLAALRALPHERRTATLDCTSGWFSTQTWDGVRLSTLLPPGDWRSVKVTSVTGYTRWFDPRADIWLATGLNGRPLTYGHGYPARIVAPGRRGFWWVKWVTDIQPSRRPPWAQFPFPLG
ncbi:molybdopterin-dependent oxidoreductase [Actinoplanes sp. NPDC049265]|uniref:molybdopterin-dependent oxidoreductase n=1 Tax=Actinoplanes sp. NPDC049265 TaxID=3363902 RepID=UPI0037217534